jgi:hypothetical protein
MLNSLNRAGRPGVAMATLLCAVGIVTGSEAIAQTVTTVQTRASRSPVGVWRMMVTFVTCDTGAAIRAPFPALTTFYRDGNASDVGSGLGPAFRTQGHGRWAWTGKYTLASRSQFHLFDANFIYFADQAFDWHLEMSDDGNTMTGKASYVRYGADGSEIFRGCATEVGTRLPDAG